MNCSTPGFPVHHQHLEFTQTQVHWVSDAIQPSHPLSSPSPPVPNPSQHQSLFQWVNSTWGGQSIRVSALASVLPKNTQDWFPLEWTGWISLQYKGLSYSAIERNKLLMYSTTWMDFKGIMLNERKNSKYYISNDFICDILEETKL